MRGSKSVVGGLREVPEKGGSEKSQRPFLDLRDTLFIREFVVRKNGWVQNWSWRY
jgi:hypothetical protein